jgi:hypothetical protein
MQLMQMQQEHGGSSVYVDGSHMEQQLGEQRVYNTNVNSTMCGDSPLVLLSGFSSGTMDASRTQQQTRTDVH